MNKLAPLLLALLVTLAPGCVAAQTPPDALQELVPNKDWDGPEDVQLWTTADADTAFVVGATSTIFRAHLSDGTTWVHCPDTYGPPAPITALRDSAESVLRSQDGYGMNGALLPLAECVTTVAAIEDSARSDE